MRCCKLQAPSGAWRTLLDDPTSYEEISATAGFGYGLLKAARLGIGPQGCREAGLRALDVVLRNIERDGTVANVSYGTRMGHDLQFYRDIPIQPTGYGQALAILCLAEGLHHVGRSEDGGMTMERSLRSGARRHRRLSTRSGCASEFLVDGLFRPGELNFVYTHVDRMILGGAMPDRQAADLRRRRGDRHARSSVGARNGHRQSRRRGHGHCRRQAFRRWRTATSSMSGAARKKLMLDEQRSGQSRPVLHELRAGRRATSRTG